MPSTCDALRSGPCFNKACTAPRSDFSAASASEAAGLAAGAADKGKAMATPKASMKTKRSFHLLTHANWGHEPAPSPLNGERAGVRGEKAKSFEFRKVRFMGSLDLLMHANWGHEPTRKRPLTPSPSPIRW